MGPVQRGPLWGKLTGGEGGKRLLKNDTKARGSERMRDGQGDRVTGLRVEEVVGSGQVGCRQGGAFWLLFKGQ